MNHQPPQRSSPDEQVVDEASAESFPASDAPAWITVHAGPPAVRPGSHEHARDLRSALRADFDGLVSSGPDGEQRSAAREEFLATAFLDAGRAVVREPVAEATSARNVEADLPGAQREAPCVVVGARYDGEDVSGATMLLAVLRALARSRTRRTLRFVAFADAEASGSDRYSERLLRAGAVHAMVALTRLDFTRERDAVVFLVGNLRSAALVGAAAEAFGRTSRIRARRLYLPSWLPGVAASDHKPFWQRGCQALMVADAAPWRLRGTPQPDFDRMAAAVPGVAALVERLAGGRA